MKAKFANRMVKSDSSEVDDILKLIMDLIGRPDVISFAGGLPDSNLFPIEDMERIAVKVLREDGKSALQYSATEGYGPLRRLIAENIMKKAGVNTSGDNIVITCGSQQGLDIAGRIFLDQGDAVICEFPTYLGAVSAFKGFEPRFVEVPMDEDGMIMEELERALQNTPKVKFIYTVPDFHNPTGITLSLDRRRKMVELAEKYEVQIIEDNPYGELRFEGERLPSIKSFDREGHVIYLGTFSKILCPGLRIGWACANSEIISEYTKVKQSVDLQTNTMSQREVTAYLETCDLDKNIDKIKSVYKVRRDLMLKTMEEEFPKSCQFTRPGGGLFTWVTLPKDVDAAEVLKRAMAEGVGFVPGIAFYANLGARNNFRMNYSSMREEQIVEGVKRLGKVLRSLE
jgi:2-aminoadipate transaminase